MRTITIHRLSLQFDADQVTHGLKWMQAEQAIDLINKGLQQGSGPLAAQLIMHRDEVEVTVEEKET